MISPGELKQRLRGVLVFAPTPFRKTDLGVDLDGYRRNMEFLAAGGIEMVAVAGFVGEFSALTGDEYDAVIRTARAALGPDRLVVAGVGYGSELAASYAQRAEAAGADCAMLLPPYLVEPTEDGMVAHVARVASATRIGVMVHSMPGFTFSPRLIERLADVPGVVAYKDELGDVRGFAEIVERVGDRLAYVNGRAEPLMAYYAIAGAGVLASAIANFDPGLALAAYDAAAASDFARLRAILAPRATPWYRLRERNRGFLISVSKASMDLMGLSGGAVRPPLSALRPEVDAELRDLMAEVGYLEGGSGMKITSVEIIPSRDVDQAHPVLVLGTDSGRRGIGEIAGDGNGGPATVPASVHALLVGLDPFEVQGLMREAVGGSDGALLSAAETAMADLSSQELGVPVHQLLGGRVRDHVRACCVHWESGANDGTTTVSAARAAVDQGFTALRIGPFSDPDPNRIVDTVHAVRDALSPRIDLAVDATGVGALEDALGLAQRLAPLEPLWLSLPFRDFDVVDLERTSLRFAVPIAASDGTAQDALVRLIRQDLVDHVIVDVGAAGGLRAARRIAALAEIYHVGFIPCATSRVSLATALHVAASVPNLTMVEMIPGIGAVQRGMVAIDVSAGLGVDQAAAVLEVA